MAKKRFNQDEIMADVAAFASAPIEKPAAPSAVIEDVTTNSEFRIQNSELKKMGRPKKVRKIVDGAPMSMMFSNDLKKKMAMVKFNQKIEMKDLIAGATVIFLDRYYRDGSLTEEGQMILEEALVKFYGE